MVNLKQELVNFSKINAETLTKDQMPLSKEVKEAVELYNNAIDRIEQNNADIAIIELKKAIKIIPDFYDAILLLGVCYFAINENMKAMNVINSIREPNERIKAISYFEELATKSYDKSVLRCLEKKSKEAKASISKNKEVSTKDIKVKGSFFKKKSSSQNGQINKIEPKGVFKEKKISIFDNPNFKKGILYSFAILLIALLAIYVIQAFQRMQEVDSPMYVQLENEYKELAEELDTYKNRYGELSEKTTNVYKRYIIPLLDDMYENSKHSKTDEIVNLINNIDFELLDEEDNKHILDIKRNVLNIYSDRAYSKGQSEFDNKNFNVAIKEFEKIVQNDPEYNQIHWVLLNLGKSYINIGNTEKAMEVFDMLIDKHKDTDAAREGAKILNNILKEEGASRSPVPIED